MLVTSTWRVTHAGVVLLDWDDYMQDEPRLDRAFTADRVTALNSVGIINLGRENVSHTVGFSRVRQFSSDYDAREFMRSHTAALQAVPEYLEIEWVNQRKGTTLASAVLTGYHSRCESSQFIADYTLAAGALVPNTTIMASAAGNDNITVNHPFSGIYVIGPAPGAAFTRTLSLLAGTAAGDICDIYISLVPGSGPTIEVHNLTSGGALLYTVTATAGGPTHAVYRAQWNGTNWVTGAFATGGGIFVGGGGGGGGGAVTSVFGRTGDIFALAGDYAAFYQPLDGDLTAIAALTGTNTIYYRSGAGIWSPVTIGGNMTFSGGTLDSTGGGAGAVSSVFGRTGVVIAASNDYSFAQLSGKPTTLSGYGITDAQPLDTDLTAIAALTGTNTIYYRSGTGVWTAVTIGGNMTFSAGTLNSVAGGSGTVTTTGTPASGQMTKFSGTTTITNAVAGTDYQAALGVTPTTVGLSFLDLANPTAITFPKITAANDVVAESAATYLTSLGGTTVGQSFFNLTNPGAITFPEISATNVVSTKTAAQLKTDLSLTATDVGLGNVTNNTQTQAAIVPNTAPSAGQILVGNAGGTAYAKQTLSGSGATATISSTGVLALSAIPESSLSITNVTTGDATTSAHGFAPKGTTGTTQFWRQDWTLAVPPSGSVSAPLTLTLTDAATSSIINVLTLDHETSGTPGAGYGGGILFQLKDNTTASNSAGQIASAWQNAVHASRTSYIDVQAADGVNSGGGLVTVLRAYGPGSISVGPTSPSAMSSVGVVNAMGGFMVAASGGVTAGKLLMSDASSYKDSAYALPTTIGASGKVLISNGTNIVSSTPTFPNASATSGKIIKSDGTNWVASTETYAVPGTSGNVMTSNGTNWLSTAPGAQTSAIPGTTTNDNAAAGNIGETVVSELASTSAVSYTTSQTKNLTSISLTAGDWDVRGMVNFGLTSMPANAILVVIGNIGTTTGTITDDGGQSYASLVNGSTVISPFMSCPLPARRMSLASTTTVYLVGKAPAFASGTCVSFGYIEARRMR